MRQQDDFAPRLHRRAAGIQPGERVDGRKDGATKPGQ
jgi:hypothetical protein